MSQIIVDTSIWIEFFRNHEPFFLQLEEKLEAGHVAGLSWIFGELLQGSKNSKEMSFILEYWNHLAKLPEDNIWLEAGIYAAEHKLFSRGVGLIDTAILIAARKQKKKIWTLDQRLAAIAAKEGILFTR